MDGKTVSLKKEAWDLLKPTQMIHLATWDGEYPRVRPVSLIFNQDKFWFCTGSNDAKVSQLENHPVFEFSLMLEKNDYRGTLRCSGETKITTDMETKKLMAGRIPFFSEYWETHKDPTFCLIELKVKQLEFMRPGEMVAHSFDV